MCNCDFSFAFIQVHCRSSKALPGLKKSGRNKGKDERRKGVFYELNININSVGSK